ncbi:type III pantothenate kinase [bacterium]|nr:type III pantothenate kinase [bacterium]
MLLVIDIGNTETVLGLYEGKNLQAHWRLSSRSPKTSDECWILLQGWLAGGRFAAEAISGAVISSVVPFWTSIFESLASERLGLKPVIVTPLMDHGLQMDYEPPATVGADRICNAVGGFTRFGGPLVVIDFGTATTFDVISGEGVYLGGVISLGLAGASQELHRVAAKLPKVDLAFPGRIVGRTTENSIQSGIMWGTVAMVEGLIKRISEELAWDRFQVIATGGMSGAIASRSPAIHNVEPFLTLDGMRIIHDRLFSKQGGNPCP